MNSIDFKRKRCVICAKEDLECLGNFKNVPIYMGIDFDDIEKIKIDQNIGICNFCGCIQLINLVDLNLLYRYPHNAALGETWKKHNEEFSKFCLKHFGKNILEVGGGNFHLSNLILNKSVVSYTIYDTNFVGNNKNKAKIKNKFIDPTSFEDKNKYDTIVMSHVFEHFYDPKSFVKLFYSILPKNGKIVISVPDITNLLKIKSPNAICFEHTYQTDKLYLNYLMKTGGFELDDFYQYSENNIFASFKKSKKIGNVFFDIHKYDKNKKIFLSFKNELEKDVLLINDILDKENDVYFFGCHIFTQLMFVMGVNHSKVKYILDNDKNKQNKKIYGFNTEVRSPDLLKNKISPIIVLKCGIYNNEIEKQLLKINKSCKILT